MLTTVSHTLPKQDSPEERDTREHLLPPHHVQSSHPPCEGLHHHDIINTITDIVTVVMSELPVSDGGGVIDQRERKPRNVPCCVHVTLCRHVAIDNHFTTPTERKA